MPSPQRPLRRGSSSSVRVSTSIAASSTRPPSPGLAPGTQVAVFCCSVGAWCPGLVVVPAWPESGLVTVEFKCQGLACRKHLAPSSECLRAEGDPEAWGGWIIRDCMGQQANDLRVANGQPGGRDYYDPTTRECIGFVPNHRRHIPEQLRYEDIEGFQETRRLNRGVVIR